MGFFFKFLLVFFLITLFAFYFLPGSEGYASQDYWQVHGVLFLVFISIFPRLTLLFSSVPFGGFFWWLGWIFCPRILVAVLATMNYADTNPILVTISWLFALGGESAEKVVVKKRVRSVRKVRPGEMDQSDVIDI